jgi:hypothetical protein
MSAKCPSCGLVSFGAQETCRRCGSPLAAGAAPPPTSATPGLSPPKQGSSLGWIVALVIGLFVAAPILLYVFRESIALMAYKPNWQELAPPGGNFSILMPKTPTKTEKPQETAVGTATLILYWADYGSVGGFGAGYVRFPTDLDRKVLVDQLLEAMAKGAIEHSKTRLVSQDSIMLGPYHGLELVSEVEGQKEKGLLMVTRIYWMPPRTAYMTIIAGKDSGPIHADRTKFFDSFRITP